MSIPDAVLSAFVEAKGCREATLAVAGVQDSLKEATKAANEATAAVNRFGRVRGIAVLDVDAAKARAQTKAATKEVNGFGATHATATADVDIAAVVAGTREAKAQVNGFSHEHAAATLEANGNGVTREVVKASAEVQAFGHEHATAKIDVDSHGASKDLREVSREADKAGGSLRGLGDGGRGGAGGLAALSGPLGSLPGGLSGMQAAGLGLGVVLLALIGPATAVVAALAPLVGLAAGAAGGLAAAAQGFGVFKLATLGVLDALKEQVKVSGASGAAAISQAGQEQAAARAISAAMEGVRSAREGVRSASEALSNAERQEAQAIAALGPAYQQARRHIQDLGSAVIDSAISLKEVRLRAIEARQALADLLSGPSPRQLADAHQAVSDAVRGETTAVRELVSAQQALNDLLAPADVLSVADAQDQVADALRGQAHAANDLADQVAATNVVLNDPSSTADQKARAQLALADAQNAVGDAARATEHAQRALNQLQAPPAADAVAAAQGRVADAQAAVGKATLATRDAADALAKVQAGASSSDIAKARLDVAAAEQAVSTATRDSARSAADYAAAQAAGVAHAPEVLAAREALRSATSAAANADRGLATAEHQLVLAQQGVSNAQQDAARSSAGLAAANVDLNKKLNALPPAAQAFVRQLIAMKGKADELRQTAAAGFFPGAEQGLVAAARNFGPVKRVIGETALVLGDLSRRAGELVGSSAFGKDIETIGGRNAKVLDTMGQALLHIVSAIRYLLVSAGPLTQWLADTANGWALSAAEAAKAGRETGRTAAFFDRTRAVLERLGSITAHVAHGLFGVGKAGTDSGNSILLSIDRAAKRFDEWANSVGGQSSIREFFAKTKALAAALLPAIANLAAGFATLALRLLPVTTALRLLGPFADQAVIAFVAYKLAVTGVNVAMKLFAAQAAIAAFATGGWTTAFWALDAAMLAFPVFAVIAGVAALAAGFIYAYQHCETFRNIVDSVFNWIKDHWPLLVGIITGPIGLATVEIATHADEIVGFFTALPGRIAGAIEAGAAALAGAVVWLKNQIVGGIEAYLGAYVSVGGWVVNRIVDGVQLMATAIFTAAGWIKNRVVDGLAAVVGGFTAAGGWIINRIFDFTQTVDPIGFLASVGGWIKNRVTDGLGLVVEGFKSLGGWIINRVFEFVTAADPVGAIASVGGWIQNRVKDALGAAKDGFVSLGGTIIGWIVDGLKGGANLLVDFLNDIVHVINKLPGVDIGDIKKFAAGGVNAKGGTGSSLGAAVGASARAFAHGGAFARTGGLVNSPITLMGEEAPRWPEIVVPTNPAYRGRAQQLAAYAASKVGLAQGGVYSEAEIEDIWKSAGGRASAARTMGIIAEAESSGDANARNPSGASGLWQILGQVVPGNIFDVMVNARNAISKSGNGQNLHPWDASRSVWGPKISGGGGGGIGGAISGAVGAVGGVLGDLLSKGAGFLLDQLPGIDKLPDWLKGTGKYVLDHAGDWIKNKVSGLVGANQSLGGGGGGATATGPNGVGTFQGIPMADWVIGALKYGRAHGAHGNPTSGYRPGFDPHTASGASEHQGTQYPHGAVDFGSFTSGLAEKMSYVNATRDYKYPLLAPIGFRDDGHASGTGHYMGGVYGGDLLGSYANGTDWVPRTGVYGLHKGEAVTPASQNTGRGVTAEDVVEALRGMSLYIGGERIDERLDVRLERRERASSQAWKADVI